ncbi:hypothetical protein J132_08163 [Termitomyces sp. J132]|nr:hypothetical protein H2248_002013 [Termitomyces sp. 'cryptogamus']KNZ78938.1 hypothetical protein J132_08163 [Termitomyces sp. J132]
MALENLLSKSSHLLEPASVLRAKAGVPEATRSPLPIEVLDSIFRFLSKSELLPATRVSRIFNDVSTRVLYHTIEELEPVVSIILLRKLDRETRLQPLVRRLEINWASATIEPTRNLYFLLHRVLTKLKGLMALSVELPRTGSQIWILDGCSFTLRYFSTSMACDARLAQYLDSQPSLTDLTLRGYHHGINTMPSFLGLFSGPETTDNYFKLLPTSLPRLTSLRTVHGGPSIIASVVEGRPIQAASIALFPSTSLESLRSLSLSSAPMRRLSIMSFDPTVQDCLVSELATRFPHLEALHVVVLLSEFTDKSLRELGPSLAPFKSLQYITFMAATDRVASPHEEQAIAKIWHHWCPTLKTIILPRGKVWFSEGPEGQLEWSSLDADD